MASKSSLVWICILRYLTLVSLAASAVVMAVNNFKLSDGTKIHFYDVIGYRYVIATTIIGFIYSAFQIPLATYHAIKERRLIRHDCMSDFDFYADKIIAFLLATGVGAGFALSFELKKIFNDLIDGFASLAGFDELEVEEAKSKTHSFYDKAYISTGLLSLGFLCMAMISVSTSVNKTSRSKLFG